MTTIPLHPPAVVPAPETESPPEAFPRSAELGEQLTRLAEAQVKIDRQKAIELARLWAIQSRD